MKNMHSTSEKTRSDAAELGAMAKMMRAALAQVGMVGWERFHHLRSAVVYSSTFAVLNPWQGAASKDAEGDESTATSHEVGRRRCRCPAASEIHRHEEDAHQRQVGEVDRAAQRRESGWRPPFALKRRWDDCCQVR